MTTSRRLPVLLVTAAIAVAAGLATFGLALAADPVTIKLTPWTDGADSVVDVAITNNTKDHLQLDIVAVLPAGATYVGDDPIGHSKFTGGSVRWIGQVAPGKTAGDYRYKFRGAGTAFVTVTYIGSTRGTATASIATTAPATQVKADAKREAASDIGFLAYWHNVPDDPGRRASSAKVVAELERRTGLPGYFVSHMPVATWWDGIAYLEAKGVKYFVVVYMDDQPTYGSTLTDALQWMMDLPGGRGIGQAKDAWAVEKPHPRDPAKYGNIADYMGQPHVRFKTFTDSVFVLTTTPTDPGPFPINAFENQVRAVMKDPANTSVMLVDHGTALDELNARWVAYRQTQADALKAKLGIKRAGAFAIREDWKELWPASVAKMIATANEWSKDSTVIHVPIRETGIAGGGTRSQIEAEFKKAHWTFAPAIMEVEANRAGLLDWAGDTVIRAAAWVRANRPASNTYFGRDEKGVEGGIAALSSEQDQAVPATQPATSAQH